MIKEFSRMTVRYAEVPGSIPGFPIELFRVRVLKKEQGSIPSVTIVRIREGCSRNH